MSQENRVTYVRPLQLFVMARIQCMMRDQIPTQAMKAKKFVPEGVTMSYTVYEKTVIGPGKPLAQAMSVVWRACP